MNLAEKLKIFRKRADLTQQELADAIGVSIMTVRRWEWGDRTPRLEEIEKIAEALGTTTDYLLNGEKSEPGATPKNPGENLPIDNAPENETPEYLDLGYWGNIVENAKRAARLGSEQEKAAALMMLRMAVDAITGAGATGTGGGTQGANIFQKADGVHGNVNQSASL